MKCSDCGHSVGKKAKFCSECGKRLSVATKHTQDETSEPKSLVAEDTREKSEINPALDNNKSVSPKRPNDFDVSMQKKKKKRKKGKNKKDDSSMMDPKSQSNPSQKESVRKRCESSSSEDSKDAMDEGPDSVQDEASHTESLDSSMASTPGAEPSEHTTGAVRDQTTDREEASDRPGESGKDKPNSPGDQIVKTAPSDTPTERPIEESKSVTSPTDEGKKSKSANKNNTRESVLDHNANVESNGKQQGKTNQTGKNKSKQKTTEQKMVFGPQPPIQAQNIGSSVDPEGPGECAEVQDSGDKQESDVAQIPADIPAAPPPKRSRSSRTIDAANRFTVCFHAVLSKDFKIDLDRDRIFVRAGPPLGTWEENIAELSVTRDLGEHGFLVEGSLPACKKQATMISIPYKYVVYKAKKEKYEYEFIYKQDSTDVTNRCLFVKDSLLDSNGDWHQYDDIICVQPTKMQQWKTTIFRTEQREGLIKGRQIAGNVMLETIFELLKSWTDVNLKNFWLQLKQFFEVYSKPFVYEEKQKRWLSLDYGEDDVRNMLKELMVHRLLPQQEHGGLVYGLDPLRAAVVMLSVCQGYSIRLKDAECFRLCAALCLPQMTKEDFTNYWADFLREVPFLRGLSEKLASLINAVKKTGNPNWILVLPLRHILNGTIKPFEEPDPVKTKYGPNWAGLEGLEVGTSRNMNSQQKQAMVNALKSHSYLIKMDPILVRSCLHLISLDELVECAGQVNVELLDMLVVVFNNTPTEIRSHSVTTVSAVLEHIHGRLIEDKYSCFTGAYRQSCLTMIVELLNKLCKGVKPETYSQNYPDVPLTCMNILALVTDFVHRNAPKIPEGKAKQQNVNDCVSKAKSIIGNWMARSFKQNLLSKGYFSSASADVEIQLWNNIISICFADDECTKSWRETFSKEFKGIYQRESARKQIEYYCSEIESLENSAPCVAAIIEMCALEAVPSLCQNKNEGQILERIQVNWKFVGLISAIIEKSWPSETPHHDDGMVLQHLLSWTAAKHIFQLYGAEKNVLAKLSEEAKKKMDAAISALVAISDDVANGNIKIALLNVILEKKEAYLDLLKIAADCFPGIERYQNKDKMKRLMECRQTEVKAVYHEKELFNILLTMTLKLEDYMTVIVDEMVERQQVVIESKRLRDFMEVHQVDHLPTDNTGVVTYFQLDRKIRDMAKDLYTLQDSHLFNVCWEKVAKQVAAEEMKANNSEDEEVANMKATSKKIRKRIFQPAYSMFQSIYELLKGGQIKLKDINQLFGTFKGNYEGLTRELLIMNRIEERSDEQWIHSRVQQIEQYHELHLAVASAEMIMMVKETLCLQGDFRVLETLREVNHVDFQNEQLNRIDNDLMKAKKILVDINEPRRLCLEELGLRRHFVKWVKDTLEDINELKVFVDLASISAGENDMDVDRIACFHDAVLGYSSMLYELKPDSDFHVFQEVVKKLWRALENDPNLPKKLRDTARHLDFCFTDSICCS